MNFSQLTLKEKFDFNGEFFEIELYEIMVYILLKTPEGTDFYCDASLNCASINVKKSIQFFGSFYETFAQFTVSVKNRLYGY